MGENREMMCQLWSASRPHYKFTRHVCAQSPASPTARCTCKEGFRQAFTARKHQHVHGDLPVRSARSPAEPTPSLTSNSWGISRRARYSLASLVFISGRISSTDHNLSAALVCLYPSQCLGAARRSLVNRGTGDRYTPLLPLSAFCCSRVWTSRPDSCRRCHLDATLPIGCATRPSSLLQRSASSAHHVCRALAQRVCQKKEGAHLLCAHPSLSSPCSPGNLLAVFRIHLITHQAPFA